MTANATTEQRTIEERLGELMADHDGLSDVEFWGRLYDLGLARVHFPVGAGGLAAPVALQALVDVSVKRAGRSSVFARNPIGVGMIAPTIARHASVVTANTYLRPLFTGEEVWCQLFSEPGAGSDLASLATRAEPAGGGWVITGQKVWTTLAHVAHRALVLARTDPDAPKHRGLTMFILDMHAPGVEARPLRQMTGDTEFNEVFLDRVYVPDRDRLGEVGQGWSVGMTTLSNERISTEKSAPRGSGAIGEALSVWAATPQWRRTPVRRDHMTALWIRAEVIRLNSIRARQQRGKGGVGPEGTTSKLMVAELNQAVFEFAVNLLGPAGTLYDTYEFSRLSAVGRTGGDCRRGLLRSRANTIEGGTSEVLRNILAERILGLPADARDDREAPWSATRRNSESTDRTATDGRDNGAHRV